MEKRYERQFDVMMYLRPWAVICEHPLSSILRRLRRNFEFASSFKPSSLMFELEQLISQTLKQKRESAICLKPSTVT